MRAMPAQPRKKVAGPSKATAAKRAMHTGANARASKAAAASSRSDPAVAAFMKELDHPLKNEVEGLRRVIVGAAPGIHEEIKWNAPSFRTTEHFATFNLRAKDRIRLIFHLGAKVKTTAKEGIEVADPAGLLEWLARDRALVTFSDKGDVVAKRAALEALVREWIRWV